MQTASSSFFRWEAWGTTDMALLEGDEPEVRFMASLEPGILIKSRGPLM